MIPHHYALKEMRRRKYRTATNIAGFDETAGNLDTVTGKEIMRLCNKTSKERG